MTDWAAILIPVGTLALGSLLTMIGQARSDRQIARRERDSRREDFRIRRYEIERDTLLALQEAVIEHVTLATHMLTLMRRGEKDVSLTEYGLQRIRIRMLASRCLDRSAGEAIDTFCGQVESHLQSVRSGNKGPGWTQQLEAASDLLGLALRRDPLG